MIHLDCTLRDGGYYTKWDFSENVVEEYLVAVKSAGIDAVELGLRLWSNHDFKGACAYTTDEFLESLNIPDGLTIGFMLNAADIIINEKLSVERLEELVPRLAAESPADLIRIASHAHEFECTLEACKWLKKKGYMVGANIMQISEHSQKIIEGLALKSSQYPLDVLYFADSLGNIKPEDVVEIVKSLRKHWAGKIGIHPHDNLLMALPNTLQALAEGVDWVDSTITGMGRGPGNLRTEEFILETVKFKKQSYNLLPLLKLVRTTFNPLKAKYCWGTNPFYYMAGQHSIHPTYIQEMLKDSQYDEEDILSVINHLKSINGAEFDFNTLTAAKNFYAGPSRGTWSPNKVLKDRTVFLIGVGKSLEQHKSAVEAYIRRERPIVLALNTHKCIEAELIDYRIACHPVRLLADANKHLELPQPLITPLSMLPETLQTVLSGKNICDFGIEIQSDSFEFNEKFCVAPSSNVLAYALSIAYSGQAKEILLSGFDGYAIGSSRNDEMNEIFRLFKKAADISVYSVTPSVYKISQKSIYAV